MPLSPVLSSSIPPTPAEPNGTPTVLRFRERVRARIGTAELLAFRTGGERFAFDVRALDEAVDAPVLERFPLAAHDPMGSATSATGGAQTVGRAERLADRRFRGIARLGVRSIPVFDTARLLGVTGESIGTQLLVMRSGARRIGLLADDVDDVIAIDLSTIKPPPVDAGDELLLGVTWDGHEVTGILDARALIAACQQHCVEVVW